MRYGKLIQLTDTDITYRPPKLNDYGGDLSKRWYIDSFIEGIKKRTWITDNPAQTRLKRATAELHKLKDITTSVGGGLLYQQLNAAVQKMSLRIASRNSYRNICKHFANETGINQVSDITKHHAKNLSHGK